MYSVYQIIYGKVLTEEEQTQIDNKLEELQGPELTDWIEEYGDSPYSGAGGTPPMYLGVCLGSIDPRDHGKLLSSIKLEPTEKQIKEVEKIREKVKEFIEFEPKVYICHSTS